MKNTNKFVNNKDFGIIAQSANLKKGGLAPGSKQNEIIAAEQKADSAFRKGSATSGLKDLVGKGSGSKAVKELDTVRKSVGWSKSNYGTGAENRIGKRK